MLHPGKRSLYTEAFKPPSGMVFDKAIGACFSLDPEFLLQVPVNLSLITGGQDDGNVDRLPLLKSIRELSDRIKIFVQKGQIYVPRKSNMLFGLLDKMIVDVEAPNDGVFHPKFWFLRFHDSADPKDVLYRLLVLSRNLTHDRSWDVAVTLEGKSNGENQVCNEDLHKLVSWLATKGKGDEDNIAKILAKEVKKVEWVLPEGYNDINFHTIGLKKGPKGHSWVSSIPESEKMAVISPFCKNSALEGLIAKTSKSIALVSRPETFLIDENQNAYKKFEKLWEIDDNAETEDGEDNSERPQWDTHGLHAKVYVMEIGSNTHIFLGSANATNAALLRSSNVELMVELIGKRNGKKGIGGIEELFGENGFGNVLKKFDVQEVDEDVDQEEVKKRQAALECLENARRIISKSKLEIRCERIGDTERYNLQLQGDIESLEGISSARVWLISAEDFGIDAGSGSVNLFELIERDSIELGQISPSQVSGLLAIELRAAEFDTGIRFVLNLPVNDLPEERDAVVLQTVVKSTDDFLHYLELLLETQRFTKNIRGQKGGSNSGTWIYFASHGSSLLEYLVKAYSRKGNNFDEVVDFVNSMRESTDSSKILPNKFLEVWDLIEEALKNEPE